jgi:prepilin peptidase CpaA
MNLALATATGILLAGVIDDFRSRKFHNWLFLACAAVAVVVAVLTQGIWGLGFGIAGFTAGLIVFLPLVLLRIIGAGDMKLMAAFGIIAGWSPVLAVAFYSLFWGAAFGVLQVVLKGQFTGLVRNLGAMTINRSHQTPTELHRIPYTAALLLGWFTYLFFQGVI